MGAVRDPATGLEFYEIGHRWGHGVPSMPGDSDVILYRSVKHAQHGVMAHRIRMVMHSGTHLNAPIHLIQKGDGVGRCRSTRRSETGSSSTFQKASGSWWRWPTSRRQGRRSRTAIGW